MNTRGLNELGYKIFLDRYSWKDTTRQTLKPGDLVLVKIDEKTGQKEIAELVALNGDYADVILHPGTDASRHERFAIEAIDKPLELDPAEMWDRVATAVAQAEQGSSEEWTAKFKWLLEDWKFIPGGRVLAGAGTNTELTFFNCFVLPSPHDSKAGIINTLNQMAQIMARGGGVGMNLSSLRPRYAYAKSTNGRSSGAVSWGELYSYTTGLVEQGGTRRGALLLMLDDWHPDLMEYINVKRDMKRIINANISVAISEEFMTACKLNADWQLKFPDTTHPDYETAWDGDLIKWAQEGRPVKIWKTVKARELWDAIISSAWACAEPGLWFKGRVNNYSNSWYYAPLISTNPCGEISLPEWGCCNLGSINLSKFVSDVLHDTQGKPSLRWTELSIAVRYAIRFLDNVIDTTPYVYEEIKHQQLGERRVGLGTMGLAEVLIKLKLRYGSAESLEFINELYKFIAVEAYQASIELAQEKGVFPFYKPDLLDSAFMEGMPKAIRDKVLEHGLRNVTLLTQAPTGTIGTMANTSTGIEPFYFWEFERKGQLGSHIERVKVYEDWMNTAPKSIDGDSLPPWFVTAQDLTPEEHVYVQAAIQQWVDSSISKTCNVPNNYTLEQVGKLYELMHELGCKGGTIYRDGSRNVQVLNLVTKAEDKTHIEQYSAKEIQGDMKARCAKCGGYTIEYNDGAPRCYNCGEYVNSSGWRKRPPALSGNSYRKTTPVGTAYITVNHNGTQEPFEVFVNVGKVGSDVAADAEGLGRLISLMLRMPSPLGIKQRIENMVAQLSGIGSGRAHGFGPNRVMSLPDAIAQVLLENIGGSAELPKLPEYEPETVLYSGDICPSCGNASLVKIEGCRKCFGCGHSEC